MNLKIFPLHTGIWEGTYTRVDANSNILGKWKSKLWLRIFDENKYQQVNEYIWDDGYREFHDFGFLTFTEQGELIFDNPRIFGKAWETHESVCLTWTYLSIPGSKVFEMINLIGDYTHRLRTWNWSVNDEFKGLTIIDERKTATQDEIPQSFWDNAHLMRNPGTGRSLII